MLVNTSDPRAQRSINALLHAAYELIDARELSRISITDVVQQAGVTRPTFYQYFRDVRDLSQQAAMARIEIELPLDPATTPAAAAEFSPEEHFDHIATRAEPIFRHLQQHHRFYLRVFDEAGDLKFFAGMAAFIGTRVFHEAPDDPTQEQGDIAARDRVRFLTNGILWTVINWLRSDFRGADSPDSISRRLAALIVQG